MVFMESWVYDYGILTEIAFSAHELKYFDEALKAYQQLIVKETLSPELRKKIVQRLLDPNLHATKPPVH